MSRRRSDWLAQHGRKRTYPSRARAWLAIARICIRERELVSRRRGDARYLVPYACTWSGDWQAGRGHVPHIHIGHRSWRKSRTRRRLHRLLVYPARRLVIWPCYRARSRWRQFQKKKKKKKKKVQSPLKNVKPPARAT
jgi:hypothetical protein